MMNKIWKQNTQNEPWRYETILKETSLPSARNRYGDPTSEVRPLVRPDLSRTWESNGLYIAVPKYLNDPQYRK
jgi:hypothetical protein